MGNQNFSFNKSDKPKIHKNNHKTESFRIGLSFGKGMSSVEGHAQIGYASHSKKRYGENAFETSLNNNNITEKENVKNLINKKQQLQPLGKRLEISQDRN